MLVRGGIAGIGESICTEVYWTGSSYFFRPRYQAAKEILFGLEEPPAGSTPLFNLRIDEPIEIILTDGEIIPGNGFPGYFVNYWADGRIQIRTHDRPGKSRKKKDAGVADASKENRPDEIGDASTPNGQPTSMEDLTLRLIGVARIGKLRKFRVDVLGEWESREVVTDMKHGLA
jgi:hypothetical protein